MAVVSWQLGWLAHNGLTLMSGASVRTSGLLLPTRLLSSDGRNVPRK